jgi:heme-degrading monooxygenase HmoA
MIAVIFEVWPKPEHKKDYLDLAAELRPLLEKIDGFISIEQHRAAQAKGRNEFFANYRLRIAGVIRDYGMDERHEVPADSRAVHG